MIDLSHNAGEDWGQVITKPHWPGWRVLWLWLRQGMPRDRPVLVQRGTFTGRVPHATGDQVAEELCLSDWRWSNNMMRAGVYDIGAWMEEVTTTYPCSVTFPDGHVEEIVLRPLPEEWRMP